MMSAQNDENDKAIGAVIDRIKNEGGACKGNFLGIM